MGIDTLFKAKPDNWKTDTGENYWVEGFYWTNLVGNHFVKVVKDGDEYVTEDVEVDPETVCQFVGNDDKNGRKIWENDFVEFCDELYTKSGLRNPVDGADFYILREKINSGCVKFDYSKLAYCIDGIKYKNSPSGGSPKRLGDYLQGIEVVGNRFDTPELLEGI